MFMGKKIQHLILAALFSTAAILTGPVASAHESGLTISDAWVRLAPATLKTHGAYLTITNHGKETKELIGASSKNYGMVQIHLSKVVDGVATMLRMESIEIPAGKTVAFKPGGLHLMLMSAKKPLAEGKMVPLTLSFRSGETIEVKAMVMKSASGDGEMMKMEHSGHEGHLTN